MPNQEIYPNRSHTFSSFMRFAIFSKTPTMAPIVASQTDPQLVIETPQIHTGSLVTHQATQGSHLRRVKESISAILTKFHAGYFRVSLSLCGQALLWKTLHIGPTDDTSTLRLKFYLFHPTAFTVLWSLAFFTLFLLSILYLLRCLFHFKLVKEEFLHHVGVNFLYAPSISWLLLLQSAPFFTPDNLAYVVLWWVFAVPLVVLDVKIYGQWFTKGKKFLSAVANPTSQLSVIGNLVGARAAANMRWKESSICLFSLGMVHYLVLFVTLYQRFSGADRLPKMLRPAFFLFFAAPSMASLAWQSINGGAFDTASKMLFFLSLFLFMSLVCRPTLFRRCMRRFNVAWWGYSFPLSVLALASTEYAEEVRGGLPHLLMLVLVAFSVFISVGLIVFTLLNTKMLLPEPDNDDDSTNSSSLSHLPTSVSPRKSTITTSVNEMNDERNVYL